MLSVNWYPFAYAITALVVWKISTLLQKAREHLPPGPKPWPLIGNLLDMPRTDARAKFSEWGRVYGQISRFFVLERSSPDFIRIGDVTYVTALGQDTVVINSLDAAAELLEKRSAQYSDRPSLEMPRL